MIQGELKLEVWTLIIEKSTVIPPSLMVLSFFGTDDPPKKGDHLLCFCAVSEQKEREKH